MLQDAASDSTAPAAEPIGNDTAIEFDVAPRSIKHSEQPSTKGPLTLQLKPLRFAQQQCSMFLDVRGADQQETSGGRKSERASSKSALRGQAWLCSGRAVGA
jgi:hypothetical protein